jgi:hypothetical protein
MINDMVTPYTYADERLEELIVCAAVQVNADVDFNYTYNVDIAQYSISPDPVSGTGEIGFQVLVCRKATYLVFNGEYRDASNKALSFKDGPSSLDTKGVADAKSKLLEEAKEAYERARTAYLTGDGLHGAAIITPHNLGVYEGQPGSGMLTSPLRDMYGNWS